MRIIKTAWRNIWRNSRRTSITLTAMILSMVVLILTYSLMRGMMIQMEASVTNLIVGEVQIHHHEYLEDRSLYDTVEDPKPIIEAARSADIASAGRSFGYGLISSGTKSAGAQFWGVFPRQEREVDDLARNMLKGEFLSEEPGMNVVLGRKLARTLNADIGSELVVVVQASDGSIGNDLFYVSGILKGVGEGIDRSVALIHYADFESLFVLPGLFHEIVLNSKGKIEAETMADIIRRVSGNNEVKTWRQIMPGVSDMLATYGGAIILFELIFFLAAGLGVLNTMLMATYERIPEFGLIKAIGASPWRIIREITAEAFILGFISSIAGGIIGTLLSFYFMYFPIDLSGFAEGFNTSGIVISASWRAALSPAGIFIPIVAMWAISVLSALYPAIKAARLDPARALNHV